MRPCGGACPTGCRSRSPISPPACTLRSAFWPRWRSDIGRDAGSSSRHRCSKSALSFGVYEAAHVAATGERPPRLGQAHRGSSPYQLFETADGSITVGASQPNFWLRLCEILELPELVRDPRFTTNADRVKNNGALVQILQARLREQPSAHWLGALKKAGIPSGPVLSFDEAMADPQIVAREMVVETEHPSAGKFRTLGIASKLSRTPGALRRAGAAPRRAYG